jgi:predicted  nucleic acid-binding Zn-ribbon protein
MSIFAHGTNSLSRRRTAAITVNVLKEYKQLISNTTSDLEEHLEDINHKLQTISLQGAEISNENATERQQLQEERDSTQNCLDICAHVLTQIDQVQPNAYINISIPHQAPVTTLSTLTSAQLVTSNTLNVCRVNLTNTTTQLERQLRDINNRLQKFSSQPLNISIEQAAEQERLKEERDCVKQSLDICTAASQQANQERTNVFEDISTADDNYQWFVSTVGDLISARRITIGSRSLTVFGQMSDDSVQHISRNHSPTSVERTMEPQTGIGPEFENRYGTGFKLSTQNPKDLGATQK